MNEIITNTIAISQETEPNISQIGENLNGMDHEGRKQWMHSMGKKQMAKLFETSQISPLQSFFVPPQKNDLEEVIHHGKNSLPVSSFFQKRFARPTGQNPQDPKEVCGYNHQDLAWLTGPGYFILHRCDEGLSDSVIDYYLTPEQKCEPWPEIKDNNGFLPGLVYGKMHDFMKQISDHVSVGRAVKNGKITSNYFILLRED